MSRQRATIRDDLQFDPRPDSPDSDTPIDLPLQDLDPASRADRPASDGDRLFQQAASSSSGRGFGAGMLVIGLVAGFGAGFLVGQHAAPPPPPASAAQARQPAPEAVVVVEPQPPVDIQEPDLSLPGRR